MTENETRPDRVGRPAAAKRSRRERHGRGLRGMLTPYSVPINRSRADVFDAMVLAVVEHLEPTLGSKLAEIEFAVEDIPPVAHRGPGDFDYDSDILDDNAVPLSRLYRQGLGDVRSPLVMVYRRPLESRARHQEDLSDLVHDVIVEQVARLLGTTPEEIDPPLG